MIKKFEVKNFKGFKDNFVLDFSNHRDYSFNSNLIKNDIVNKAIIYGKNGSGKSDLGLALYDLTTHLTDKKKHQNYNINYRNLDNPSTLIEFKYTFAFGADTVVYEYMKIDSENLVFERLSANGEILLMFDYEKKKYINNIESLQSLNINLPDNKLSGVKYVYRNSLTDDNSLVTKVVKFAEGMLWFRSLNDGNSFIGFRSDGETLDSIIAQHDKVADFQEFLCENGLQYNLIIKELNGNPVLFAKFTHGDAVFSAIASSGTISLWLYYCWSLYFDNVSFLYIDEFDAYYHYETAEIIFNLINRKDCFQSILTTHNTYLMQNKNTRPDCCFIMFENSYIKSLSECTDKELREAHNLEKMYRSGAFIE